MPKISVIVPAYNVENYIFEALESLFIQLSSDDEVILINDGSTDSTLDIARRFESIDNYKIISTSNFGLAAARNTGFEYASGEYIYFFDSDDLLSEDFFSKIKNIICNQNNPDLICFSGGVFFDDDYEGDYKLSYKRNITQIFSSGAEAFSKLYQVKGLKSSACLYVARKKFLSECGLKFKSILHEDEEILLPLFFSAGRTVVIDDVLFLRRVRSDSIMTKDKTQKNLDGYIATLKTLIEFKEKNPYICAKWKRVWKDRGQEVLITITLLKKRLGKRLVTLEYAKLFFYFFDYRIFGKILSILTKRF